MLLAFTDLETTHREPDKGSVLEVAMVITDPALNVLGFYSQNVRPLFSEYDFEDDDVLKMHTENGLVAEIDAGDCLRRYEAELNALAWLESFGPEQLRIVGNSIHFDLAWLREHMPRLAARFHRHLLDITSINKFAELFAPDAFKGRPRDDQKQKHRALYDAKQSLRTLEHYRDNFRERFSLPQFPGY